MFAENRRLYRAKFFVLFISDVIHIGVINPAYSGGIDLVRDMDRSMGVTYS